MRKHLVLLGILGLGVGLAGFAQTTSGQPAATNTFTITQPTHHAMGASCSGSDDSVCHLTVSGIRADEKNPSHSAVNLSTDKQDSLHISGDSPFTVEFVSDDKGPAPFYRPTGKAFQSIRLRTSTRRSLRAPLPHGHPR
jgi:hypothetical protein